MLLPEKSERQLPAGACREHLARVLASPLFERSPRQSSFLRFVVEKVLAGEAAEIKEYEIAVNVYGRRTDHSTRVDPIVRVEAARLRSKLLEYYSTEGRKEEFRIELPKGAYVPEFVFSDPLDTLPLISTPLDTPPIEQPGGHRRRNWWLAALIGTGAACLTFIFVTRGTGSPLIPPNSKIPSSIAVMPIQSADPQVGRQMTEALFAEMRQRNWPHWHLRSSVISGDPALPDQHADAVFRGSVTLSDGILRLTGSLEHVQSKIVLWNGTVERKLGAGPESERAITFDDLAYATSENMNVALMERQEQEIAAVYPRRVEARHNWLEANELWRRGDRDSVRRAIPLLEKSIALDPNFAWIHASLAFAYVRAVELGLTPEATYRRRAHEESARALELGPYLPPAHAAAVRVALALDWNTQAASATCISAFNMLSSSYSVRDECAELYSLVGRNDAAGPLEVISVRRAVTKVNPLSELAWIHYRSRRFEEAQSVADQALSINKNYVPARCAEALTLMLQQHPGQALEFIRTGAADPTGRLVALAATALALQGQKEAAEAELLQAERQLTRPDRTDLIRPYLALGLTDRAKVVIEEAITQRNAALLELAVDPQIADLDRTGIFDTVRSRSRN